MIIIPEFILYVLTTVSTFLFGSEEEISPKKITRELSAQKENVSNTTTFQKFNLRERAVPRNAGGTYKAIKNRPGPGRYISKRSLSPSAFNKVSHKIEVVLNGNTILKQTPFTTEIPKELLQTEETISSQVVETKDKTLKTVSLISVNNIPPEAKEKITPEVSASGVSLQTFSLSDLGKSMFSQILASQKKSQEMFVDEAATPQKRVVIGSYYQITEISKDKEEQKPLTIAENVETPTKVDPFVVAHPPQQDLSESGVLLAENRRGVEEESFTPEILAGPLKNAEAIPPIIPILKEDRAQEPAAVAITPVNNVFPEAKESVTPDLSESGVSIQTFVLSDLQKKIPQETLVDEEATLQNRVVIGSHQQIPEISGDKEEQISLTIAENVETTANIDPFIITHPPQQDLREPDVLFVENKRAGEEESFIFEILEEPLNTEAPPKIPVLEEDRVQEPLAISITLLNSLPLELQENTTSEQSVRDNNAQVIQGLPIETKLRQMRVEKVNLNLKLADLEEKLRNAEAELHYLEEMRNKVKQMVNNKVKINLKVAALEQEINKEGKVNFFEWEKKRRIDEKKQQIESLRKEAKEIDNKIEAPVDAAAIKEKTDEISRMLQQLKTTENERDELVSELEALTSKRIERNKEQVYGELEEPFSPLKIIGKSNRFPPDSENLDSDSQ